MIGSSDPDRLLVAVAIDGLLKPKTSPPAFPPELRLRLLFMTMLPNLLLCLRRRRFTLRAAGYSVMLFCAFLLEDTSSRCDDVDATPPPPPAVAFDESRRLDRDALR